MQTMDNNNLEIKSPPRPRRLLGPQVASSQSSSQSSQDACRHTYNTDPVADVQSQMVDRSMSALPSVFTQVFSMQRAQTDDLQRYQTMLQSIKDEIKKGETKQEELQQELTCVMNKIFQCDETIKDKAKNIRQLETEIQQLIVSVVEEQMSLSRQEEYLEAERRKMNKHKTKSSEFFERVAEYERTHSEEYRRLQEAKANVQVLRDQYEAYGTEKEIQHLLSGYLESEIQTDIKDIKTRTVDLEEDTETMKKQIAEEESKKNRLEQTLKVLQKRNTAQMTRLKRQLREVQVRNRQRQNHVTQLKDNLIQTKQQLELVN